MRNDDDRVRVAGSGGAARRSQVPGPLLMVAGLAVGLAIGLIVAPRDSGNEAEEPSPSTTVLPTSSVVVTTDQGPIVESLRSEMESLESELEAARRRVAELSIEAAPVAYAPVVDCEASLQDQFGADWQADSYFVGPMWFYRLSEILAGGETFVEVFAGVERGDSVTLVIPASERRNYSLLWNPATWSGGGYTVDSGEPAVTLRACDQYPTAFIGGFVTATQYCAGLDVYYGDGESVRIQLPFGSDGCPDEPRSLARPATGPLPDVRGSRLREARNALRLVGVVPAVNGGDAIAPDAMVWAQEPGDSRTYPPGTVIGLRTCEPADEVAGVFQRRVSEADGELTKAWMASSREPSLDNWVFVSALVVGGEADNQVATWALPAFGGAVDPVNTPGLAFPANAVAGKFDFGDRRFTPQDYGVAEWVDLDGAIATQRCVALDTGS